jgi:hypothetical protein
MQVDRHLLPSIGFKQDLLPIVIVPLWLLLWWAAVEIVWLVHLTAIHTHTSDAAENWMKGILIAAARGAMDAEGRAFPDTEYATAQNALLRLTKLSMPAAIAFVVIGSVAL